MNSSEILNYLGEINQLDNIGEFVDEYLSNQINQPYFDDLYSTFKILKKIYSLNTDILEKILQIPSPKLKKLNDFLNLVNAKKIFPFYALMINFLDCAVYDTDKFCIVISELLENFSKIDLNQLTLTCKPEKIDSLAKILTVIPTEDKHKTLKLLTTYSFLLKSSYDEILPKILDKMLSLDPFKIAYLGEAIFVLDEKGILNLDTLSVLVDNPTRMKIRSYAMCLFVENNLDANSLDIVSRENFAGNHLKVLNTLNDSNILNSDIIRVWFAENPSDNYASLQNTILNKFKKFELLCNETAMHILQFSRGKLKKQTIYDWSRFILNSTNLYSSYWANEKISVNSIDDQYYLDNLLALRSLDNLANKYSVNQEKFYLTQISQIKTNNSLLVNNQVFNQAYTLIARLETLSLLNTETLNAIINHRIHYYRERYPEYFNVVLAMINSLFSINKINQENTEKLFATNDLDSLSLYELLKYFIPDLKIKNPDKLFSLESYLSTQSLDIHDHIKVMPELIDIYGLLQKKNKLNDDIIIGLIRFFAMASKSASYSSGGIYSILHDTYEVSSYYSSKKNILALIGSHNAEYLSSSSCKLFKLKYATLKKLLISNAFLYQLQCHANLDELLNVLSIMEKTNAVITPVNILDLIKIDINQTFIKLLDILTRSQILTGIIFYELLNYHHYFMDENSNPIIELDNNLHRYINLGHWNDFVTICRQNNSIDTIRLRLRSYIVEEILNRGIIFNPPESTHTASVHLATDITFWMLMTKYPEIDFAKLQDNMFYDLAIYENSKRLAEHESSYSWKLCVGITGISYILSSFAESSLRLTSERKQEAFNFMQEKELFANPEIQSLEFSLSRDISSSLEESIPRYILLIYHEITTNRSVNTTDYELIEAFLFACYESVRGRNLDSIGNEINRDARNFNICAGGIANKFCEILTDQSPLILYFYADKMTIIMQAKTMLIKNIREKCIELIKTSPYDAKLLLNALANADEISNSLSEQWKECEESVRSLIYEIFKYFFSKEEIKLFVDEFVNDSLEYIPSVKHSSAKRHYSLEFLTWYSEAESNLAKAKDAKRSYGIFTAESSTSDESCSINDKRLRK